MNNSEKIKTWHKDRYAYKRNQRKLQREVGFLHSQFPAAEKPGLLTSCEILWSF